MDNFQVTNWENVKHWHVFYYFCQSVDGNVHVIYITLFKRALSPRCSPRFWLSWLYSLPFLMPSWFIKCKGLTLTPDPWPQPSLGLSHNDASIKMTPNVTFVSWRNLLKDLCVQKMSLGEGAWRQNGTKRAETENFSAPLRDGSWKYRPDFHRGEELHGTGMDMRLHTASALFCHSVSTFQLPEEYFYLLKKRLFL